MTYKAPVDEIVFTLSSSPGVQPSMGDPTSPGLEGPGEDAPSTSGLGRPPVARRLHPKRACRQAEALRAARRRLCTHREARRTPGDDQK